MNFFKYVNTQKVLLRPFIYPKDLPLLEDFTPFYPLRGAFNDTDPVFDQYEPFKKGYNFSFEFRLNENLDFINEIVDNNQLVEILVQFNQSLQTTVSPNSYFRIGDKNGFKIVDFKEKYSLLCEKEYIIKLQSARPLTVPFEQINFQNNEQKKIGRKRVFKFEQSKVLKRGCAKIF